jgi:hypothetical protein
MQGGFLVLESIRKTVNILRKEKSWTALAQKKQCLARGHYDMVVLGKETSDRKNA